MESFKTALDAPPELLSGDEDKRPPPVTGTTSLATL